MDQPRSTSTPAGHALHLSTVVTLHGLWMRAGAMIVLQRRLDRAMRRLQSPDERKRSISEIAFDVGFGDLSYFNRTFRRRFDTSPRLVRAKHRSVPTGSARSEAPDAGSA